jgi:hypothetical protein
MYEVSGSYFDMLGVQPEVGRLFHTSDEHGPNSAPYIVLSDSYWRSHFGGDPRVVGSVVDLNKHPFTVIGVTPAEFHGTEMFLWPDFWAPMINEEQIEGYSFLVKRYNHGLFVVGEMKPECHRAAGVERPEYRCGANGEAEPDRGRPVRHSAGDAGLVWRSGRRRGAGLPERRSGAGAAGADSSVRESGEHFCGAGSGSRP